MMPKFHCFKKRIDQKILNFEKKFDQKFIIFKKKIDQKKLSKILRF